MRHENAATRVRQRIAEWVTRHGHGSKKVLAEKVRGLYGHSRSPSWITDILDGPDKGGQDLRLRDLDAIADAMRVPPGELVSRPDAIYMELSASEARILRHYRAMPDVIRGHLLAYLDYIYSFQERALSEQASERDRRTTAARIEIEHQRKKA